LSGVEERKRSNLMERNNRSATVSAAAASPWLVAAAAVAATLVAVFLLLPAATHAARATGATVSTAQTGLGRVLVNSSGRTLYLFGKDKRGKSSCAGQCATFWPPLFTKGKPHATGGAKASLLGMTRRADGRMQVTYNHHPLYTFEQDTMKGQTNGEGVTAFGATWDAVSAAGAKVQKAKAPPSSGGGYGGGGSYGP
jgi:predicted lipoprotein with Yx(FWY)xxD motif